MSPEVVSAAREQLLGGDRPKVTTGSDNLRTVLIANRGDGLMPANWQLISMASVVWKTEFPQPCR